MGRWQSADPLGEAGGINLYGYVENDPINSWDPLGLEPYLDGPSKNYDQDNVTSFAGYGWAETWKMLNPPRDPNMIQMTCNLPCGPGGGAKILGFGRHAVNQSITRGFTAPRILQIVRDGTAVQAMGRYGAQTRYVLGNNTVVINAKNILVTAYSTAKGTAKGLGRGFYDLIK